MAYSARAMGEPLPTSRSTYIGKGRGRGRGRGKPSAVVGDASQQLAPGSRTASHTDGSRHPISAVGRVSQLIETAASSTNSQSLAEQVLNEANTCITSDDELKQLSDSIYKWALQSPDRANRTAIVCNALGSLERGNVKFRSPFIKMLKKDYDSRDNWMHNEESRWLSLACLLCQFFKEFKLGDSRVTALKEPTTNCLKLLLAPASSSNSHKYGVQQLCEVGQLLDPDKIDKMMADLRQRLLASETLSASRVLFLEALEVYAGGWQMDESAAEFYTHKTSGV